MAAAAPAPLVLRPDAAIAVDLQPQALAERGALSAAAVAGGRLDGRLAPSRGGIVALNGGNELWIPLRLHNPSNRPQAWQLQLPSPSIDEASLFEPAGTQWTESSAGDRVSRAQWSRPGRYPSFALRLEAGETRPVILRVRNAVPAPVPALLVGDASAQASELRAELGFGVVLGALALLVAACLIQAVQYRDASYFLYGAYALLLGLAFGAMSGLAGQYVWGHLTDWNDASKSAFPLAAAGVSVWLVRALCQVPTRARGLSRATAAVGAAVIALAMGFAVLRSVVPALVAAGMLATTATVLTIVAWAWRRGEPMGAWVLAAHAPLIGVTALLVLRMFGIEPIAFDASTLLSLAIGVILVLLLVALSRRSREVLSVQVRDKDMAAIDPLTGLLSAPLFRGRVRAAVGRYASSRHDAAVIYVRLANYPRIRELHGNDVAEQSMIRAAMKLQRMMHGADCFGRVSESTLGLIFETVTGRGALMERASRLVAHGLMPLPGIQPDVVLQLHVVANVLSDNPLEADHVHSVLENALASMSPRTRRPIRFLVPGATSPQTDLGAPGPADGGTQQHHARAAA